MVSLMSSVRSVVLTTAAVLGIAISAFSQGMMRPPHVPGEFKPVVGSGGEYQMTMKDGKTQAFAMAVVGKETVEGQDAYWLEWRMDSQRGKILMKQLMLVQPGNTAVKRMIVQTPGRPPMEMPIGMMAMGMQHEHQMESQAGGHGMGEMVGSQTVTVPAGSFDAQHFRSTDNGRIADVWASAKVSPYGLVKMTSSDGTSMILQKVLDHEGSQITGEHQKMNFPGMTHSRHDALMINAASGAVSSLSSRAKSRLGPGPMLEESAKLRPLASSFLL